MTKHISKPYIINGVTITIEIEKSNERKCARCWQYMLRVDYFQWANVCCRCNDVLDAMFKQNPTLLRGL